MVRPYETNYMIDTDHGIIVDVEATPARLSQEIVAAKKMLERSAKPSGMTSALIASQQMDHMAPARFWRGC